jgi:hypothetical protein
MPSTEAAAAAEPSPSTTELQQGGEDGEGDGKKRKRPSALAQTTTTGKRTAAKKKRMAEEADDEAATAAAEEPEAAVPAPAPVMTVDEEGEEDGRVWRVLEPLRVAGKEYGRVMCESMENRIYYAMNPFAYDVLGMPGHQASSHIQHCVGWPDRISVTSKLTPRDCERLRRIGFIGNRLSLGPGGAGAPGARVRVLVTADAIRVVVATVPGLKGDAKVMAGVKLLEDALAADKPVPLPDPPAPPAEELAAATKADAKADAEEEAAMAAALIPGPNDEIFAELLAATKEVQAGVGQARSTLVDLRRDIDAIKARVATTPEGIAAGVTAPPKEVPTEAPKP